MLLVSKTSDLSHIQMWEKYYKLSSSPEFCALWVDFLRSAIVTAIFYQFVTEEIMNDVIRIQFPLDMSPTVDNNAGQKPLDFEEANALRYCGGHVLRSLRKKVNKSANPLKQQLLLCLADLFES